MKASSLTEDDLRRAHRVLCPIVTWEGLFEVDMAVPVRAKIVAARALQLLGSPRIDRRDRSQEPRKLQGFLAPLAANGRRFLDGKSLAAGEREDD